MPDTRLVQTAVLRHTRSQNPVLMPYDTQEALSLRAALANKSIWCGYWLGGCGKQLTMRIGAIKVPHFAHYPDPSGRPVTCRRKHLDATSADHLYINQLIGMWFRNQGMDSGAARFHGDFGSGGGCHRLTVAVPDADGAIVVAFHGADLDSWQAEEEALLVGKSWVTWMFGPGVRAPADLLARDQQALHLRFEQRAAGRELLIGTETRSRATEWIPLSTARVESTGVRTTETPNTPVCADTPAHSISRGGGPAGPDRAAEGGAVALDPETIHAPLVDVEGFGPIPLSELRSMLARFARTYGFMEHRQKAAICTTRARELKAFRSRTVKLESWIIDDLVGVRDGRLPGAAAGSSRLVDPGPEFDPASRRTGLDRFLKDLGWDPTADPLWNRWLNIALMHRSYLGERRPKFESSALVLDVPEEVGKRWLALILLDQYVLEHRAAAVGTQATAHATLKTLLYESLLSIPEFASAARFGVGESARGNDPMIAASTRSVVIQQVCGAIALLDGIGALQELVSRRYAEVSAKMLPTAERFQVDWRTTLQQVDPKVTFEILALGPDHDKHFVVTARGQRARVGKGAASSKRAAAQQASRDFLHKHHPDALKRVTAKPLAAQRSAPKPLPLPGVLKVHWHALRQALSMLGIERTAARAELSQAFIHSSWIYENKTMADGARQSDNSVLAHHGSAVADAFAAHLRAQALLSATIAPDSDASIVLTPPSILWRDILAASPLRNGVLLGTGQATDPEPTYANVMQALLAVAWRVRGIGLFRSPPPLVRAAEDALRRISILDDHSRLAQLLGPFGILLTSEFNSSGPDHQRMYVCRITLTGAEGRRTVTGPQARSKSTAQARCATELVTLLATISGAQDWALDASGQALARFILRQQVLRVDAPTGAQRARLISRGVLGCSHLAADNLTDFAAWAEQATGLVGEISTEQAENLRRFYIAALDHHGYVRASAVQETLINFCERAARDDIHEYDDLLLGAAERILRLGPTNSEHGVGDAVSTAVQWTVIAADRRRQRNCLEIDGGGFALLVQDGDPVSLIEPMRSLLADHCPEVVIGVSSRRVEVSGTASTEGAAASILQAGALALNHTSSRVSRRQADSVAAARTALTSSDAVARQQAVELIMNVIELPHPSAVLLHDRVTV